MTHARASMILTDRFRRTTTILLFFCENIKFSFPFKADFPTIDRVEPAFSSMEVEPGSLQGGDGAEERLTEETLKPSIARLF